MRKLSVQNALEFMVGMIDEGVEYSVAHERACMNYVLTEKEGESLTRAYDDKCERESQR